MRIVQIIDSLEAGGAERMAVNYANELAKRIEFSGLISTRKEGDLKSQIDSKVEYLFLNKRKIIDFNAVLKLKNYCIKNSIEIVQAHGSSYFSAFLLKLFYPKIQIIWHYHNGSNEFLNSNTKISAKILSVFFKGVIVVNHQLKNWILKELNCKNVIYLPNFTNHEGNFLKETTLYGVNGKRIICLANLRAPKNHFLLLQVAKRLKGSHPNWSFHLIGKDYRDDYSNQMKKIINKYNLDKNVYLYNIKNDITHIFSQVEIAILTSKYEGLPVSLLEYGLSKKAVVVTSVGEIPLIIKNGKNGFIVPIDDVECFFKALLQLIENPELRIELGNNLYETMIQNYSENAVMDQYFNWLNKII